MNFASRALAVVTLASVVCFVALRSRKPPDPLVRGRPVSGWVRDLLSPDYNVRGEAQSALLAGGETAVPQIRELLRERSPFWEAYIARLGAILPVRTGPRADPALCRQRGAEMIARLGPIGVSAVPELIDSLAYSQAAIDTERALLRVGEPAVAGLLKALRHRNEDIRSRSAKLLKEFVSTRREVAPALLDALKDDSASVRREAARSLGEACTASAVVEALQNLTKDTVAEVRAAALESLGKCSTQSAKTIETVRSSLSDPIPVVRLEAAKALWLLTKDRDTVVPVLAQILQTREGWQAAYALGDIGPPAAEAVPALIEVLKTEKVPRAFRTPPSSSVALGHIKEPAIPALSEALKNPEPRIRLSAVLAFSFMGKHARPAVPFLLELLRDPVTEVRHVTAITLAGIGAERDLILAGLTDCLNAEDIYLRSAAAAHLREIAPEQAWAVPAE